MGVAFGIVPVLVLLGILLPIAALIDLVRRPVEQWSSSGQNQLIWALVIIFMGFIGPVLYFLIARPALQAAQHRTSSVAEMSL